MVQATSYSAFNDATIAFVTLAEAYFSALDAWTEASQRVAPANELEALVRVQYIASVVSQRLYSNHRTEISKRSECCGYHSVNTCMFNFMCLCDSSFE